MTLQDKYPTLEQSKRIAELLGGNAPESQMVWYRNAVQSKFCLLQSDQCHMSEHYPAYDLAELGEIIPESLYQIENYHDSDNSIKSVWKRPLVGKYGITYTFEYFPTEAQARAALIIHLLEQKQ